MIGCLSEERNRYLNRIRPFYHNDLIKIIGGIRRCGKSVILKRIRDEIIENGIDEAHIIFVNFEDLVYSYIKNEMDLYQYVKERMLDTGKYYMFFDEIQNVYNFEKALNSFRATDSVSIFITGSNSRLLSGELSSLLSGRYVSFQIMPFSFSEVCEYKEIARDNVTQQHLMEYLKWGECHKDLS